MPRAQEAALLRRVELVKPILDLGCGDGSFAALAGGLHGALGVDLDRREVSRARARGAYRLVINADAGRLPFRTASLGSVVSISTLEHIPGVENVLAEIARVLRPGGRLACSMPGPEFGPSLFWPRVLRRLGGDRAARRYVRLVDAAFRHRNLLTIEEWERLLSRAGFRLLDVRRFNPPAAAAVQDLAYPCGAVASGVRRLTGRWTLVPGWRRRWAPALGRALMRSLDRGDQSGTCYFFHAEVC